MHFLTCPKGWSWMRRGIYIYLADKSNNAIREITPAGVVTTFAGSVTGASGYTDASGTSALFNGR